jgi:hypothetical protein
LLPLAAVLIVTRDEILSPEAANKAKQRPRHGLDQQNGMPGSPNSGPHDLLVPPFSPLEGMSWGFDPALPPFFLQGNIPAPLPSPANTVNPGYFAARLTLSEAFFQVYPNAPEEKIFLAVEVAFEAMERQGYKLW